MPQSYVRPRKPLNSIFRHQKYTGRDSPIYIWQSDINFLAKHEKFLLYIILTTSRAMRKVSTQNTSLRVEVQYEEYQEAMASIHTIQFGISTRSSDNRLFEGLLIKRTPMIFQNAVQRHFRWPLCKRQGIITNYIFCKTLINVQLHTGTSYQ